jgi:ectoine hydroxylase-related dioxygenase (phytanoyl-CoA dioxygenase family)
MEAQTAEDLEQLERVGYVRIERAIAPDAVGAVREALAPHLGRRGRNPFEGQKTRRAYALLAKTRALDSLVLHPRIAAICDAVLSVQHLLSAALAVDLLPGEVPQPWHADGAFYGVARPHPPIGISTVWALDDFTDENGATELLPGSHRSEDAFPVAACGAIRAVMPAGSVIVYPDTLVHRSGANRSDANRLGLTIQYCAGWARPIETMTLAVPRDVVRTLPERLQSLLGYSIYPPFIGYVDGAHPRRMLEAPASHPLPADGGAR